MQKITSSPQRSDDIHLLYSGVFSLSGLSLRIATSPGVSAQTIQRANRQNGFCSQWHLTEQGQTPFRGFVSYLKHASVG